MNQLSPKCIECSKDYTFWNFGKTPGWRFSYCSISCKGKHENKLKYGQGFSHQGVSSRVSCGARLYCSTCSGQILKGKTFFRKGKKKNKIVYCSAACIGKPLLLEKPKKEKTITKLNGLRKRFKDLSKSKKSSDFYLSGEWRVLRYEVIKERGGKCEACGVGPKDGKKIHVDHIKPRVLYKNLEYEKSNLQLLCEDCNLGKGAWDETDWRKI